MPYRKTVAIAKEGEKKSTPPAWIELPYNKATVLWKQNVKEKRRNSSFNLQAAKLSLSIYSIQGLPMSKYRNVYQTFRNKV